MLVAVPEYNQDRGDGRPWGLEVIGGVYLTGFNGGFALKYVANLKFESYPTVPCVPHGDEETGFFESIHFGYGVCDDIDNLLRVAPDLVSSPRRFMVTLAAVQRDPSNRGNGGGWRWHKWGPYIGAKKPQFEYLDDEEDIDLVYCFHIYELL